MARRVTRACIPCLVLLAILGAVGARAEDLTEGSRTAGLIAAYWGYPTRASVSFGVIAAQLPTAYDCKTPCLFRGVTFQGAAGLGGGELALGYGSLIGETAEGDWLLRRVFVGYGVRAAILRTWGLSTLKPDGATFAGVEGAMSIAQFGMRLGLFRQIEPGAGRGDWRVFGGAGWGF